MRGESELQVQCYTSGVTAAMALLHRSHPHASSWLVDATLQALPPHPVPLPVLVQCCQGLKQTAAKLRLEHVGCR